jgi:hypothetical protein
LNDIAEMASRYNVKIETRKVSGVRPANAILNEAKAGAHDLIVMGVSRRPGERLYFGDTPTAVLAKSPCSLLFLSDLANARTELWSLQWTLTPLLSTSSKNGWDPMTKSQTCRLSTTPS